MDQGQVAVTHTIDFADISITLYGVFYVSGFLVLEVFFGR